MGVTFRKPPADLYEKGIDLFNRGEYFECHEVWEEVWKRSSGEEKLFYQGIIQAAVALLHAERGNVAGAASQFKKAREKLDPLPAVYGGIALGELRDALQKFFADVTGDDRAPRSPAVPRIRRLKPPR
jgi:uncharacterized protein